MTPNPSIMQAVEQLGYRVTAGDVATQAGLNIELAQQGLLTLASSAGGHMQVAESGDVVYKFEPNFRSILRNKYLQLRLQAWWQQIWKVLFYLIRISFGILLIASIILIYVAIIALMIAANSSSNNNRSNHFSGASFFYFPDLFWYFGPNYNTQSPQQREEGELNFFAAIFSFLFGDGNPNADLDARRWQEIAAVIRQNYGAVVAEQIAPYLDEIGQGYAQEYEDYMLPVLLRFNGQPLVSPEGQIVYYFPELQVTANKSQRQPLSVYLQEFPWRFSAASSGQILLSVGLGGLNLIGALVLGDLFRHGVAAKLGGLIGFVHGIYWLLLGYGTAFFGVPLVRYFWIQWRNRQIAARNQKRQARAKLLVSADQAIQEKIAYARQFAKEKFIGQEDLAYTTETDLLEQEAENSAKTDAEWQRRLQM